MACLPRFTISTTSARDRERPEVLSMVDGVGGMVHVSFRFHRGPGRVHPRL